MLAACAWMATWPGCLVDHIALARSLRIGYAMIWDGCSLYGVSVSSMMGPG